MRGGVSGGSPVRCTHHDSLRSMCSSFCATFSTPTAASGCRSWLLIEMRASTAVWGDDWNSSSL